MKVIKMTGITLYRTQQYYKDKFSKHEIFIESYFTPGKALYRGQLNNKDTNLFGRYIDAIKDFYGLCHELDPQYHASLERLESTLKYLDETRLYLES